MTTSSVEPICPPQSHYFKASSEPIKKSFLFPDEDQTNNSISENASSGSLNSENSSTYNHITNEAQVIEGIQLPIENVEKKDTDEALNDLFLRMLREQIEQDRTQGAHSQENTLPPFIVPRGKEDLFNAPLNTPLLKRDYAIWKRLLGISQFIFTQSALQFQGLSKGSMLMGAAAGAFITKYFPVYSVVGISSYAGYRALSNLAAAFIGTNSIGERGEIWSSAASQESFFQGLSRRVTSIMGTDSFLNRLQSAAWGLAQAYLVGIGHDFIFQRQDNPWTSFAVELFKGAQKWVLPIPAAIAAGGIGYFGMMLAWSMNAQGSQKLQDQFEGFSEDINFSGEYRRLLYLSDEEYQQELLKALGVNHVSELEEKRKEYANQVRARMRFKKYLGADQVQIDANVSLKKLNSTHPHRSLKSVLAQYNILVVRKKTSLEYYKQLINQHAYPQAHVFLNQVLKPLLLKVEFLKQTLLDPTRPPLGLLSKEGSEYYSYVSVLSGTEIQENITLTDPKELEKFFCGLLINETAIHKYLCFERGIMEVDPGYLIRQAELMKV